MKVKLSAKNFSNFGEIKKKFDGNFYGFFQF